MILNNYITVYSASQGTFKENIQYIFLNILEKLNKNARMYIDNSL